MKYIHRAEVRQDLAESSEKIIKAINDYVDDLRGVIVTVKTIRSGQPRPYADTVYESLIFCYRPSVLTTGGPVNCPINRKQAEQLVRIFVSDWDDEPKFLDPRLELLRPEPDPCGLDKPYTLTKYGSHLLARKPVDPVENTPVDDTSSNCWRVVVRWPYCD